MTVTRIMKLSDGEELICFEAERRRPVVLDDDPRNAALERRAAAEASARTVRPAPRQR